MADIYLMNRNKFVYVLIWQLKYNIDRQFLKYEDWLVKSASKKKNENSPPNTTIEKSGWLLCTKSRFTYNKANQLSKILFYQDISIFANAIYQNQHQTKSISALPLAYTLLLLLLQDCQ